jgi:hypothetical protein
MALLPIDLTTIAAGTGGFVINGQSTGDYSGISVASAGDVNGDGFDDLIVGAYLEADPKRFRNNCMSHFSVLRESDPSSMKKVA